MSYAIYSRAQIEREKRESEAPVSDRPDTDTRKPDCADVCIPELREAWAKACGHAGVPVAEAHVSHLPLLVKSPYLDLQMTCPHGVLWHMQPTSEQIAEWVEDGIE